MRFMRNSFREIVRWPDLSRKCVRHAPCNVSTDDLFHHELKLTIHMKATDSNEACIQVCNSLLRGELSAVETYSLAINHYAGKPAVPELQKIRTEHALSAARLSQNIREMGGTPEDESGAWGVFAKVVQGAANLFGEDSALESLKKGEEKGRSDYEAALEGNEMMDSHKETVRSELLPRVNHHIATLDRLEILA